MTDDFDDADKERKAIIAAAVQRFEAKGGKVIHLERSKNIIVPAPKTPKEPRIVKVRVPGPRALRRDRKGVPQYREPLPQFHESDEKIKPEKFKVGDRVQFPDFTNDRTQEAEVTATKREEKIFRAVVVFRDGSFKVVEDRWCMKVR